MEDGINANRSCTTRVCIHVCTACIADDRRRLRSLSAGQRLFDRLTMSSKDIPEIEVMAVDCLAVCDRPVTIAFQAEGKWSYTIGDVDPEIELQDIIDVGKLIFVSEYGILKMVERPRFFRNGVISRLPPSLCSPNM